MQVWNLNKKDVGNELGFSPRGGGCADTTF